MTCYTQQPADVAYPDNGDILNVISNCQLPHTGTDLWLLVAAIVLGIAFLALGIWARRDRKKAVQA